MKIFILILVVVVLWSVWGFFGSRVEQADYTVVKKMEGYELRKYPEHIVAQTTVRGQLESSMSEGFSIVASYIFGGNVKKESIAMTAPVVVEKGESIAMTAPVMVAEEGDSRTVSFGMPRSYTYETLPTPTDPRVKLVVVPEKTFAVMRFSWYRTDARIKEKQGALLEALKRDGVVVTGGVAYAGYNAPWTPPWMNRNEVLVEVAN